ncbi:MAG: hypothetical protein IJG84_17590 [Kiritimatiellae bacterium]|nr:hypothetical protein [Kiritimatiellia bacterium]
MANSIAFAQNYTGILDEIYQRSVANKPEWYHQSTKLGTANQLSWYRR